MSEDEKRVCSSGLVEDCWHLPLLRHPKFIISWILSIYFIIIYVFPDCNEVVDLLNNSKSSRTGISWVISDIQEKQRDFKEVKFRHIPRTCNTCAHSLEKLAVGANTSAIWLDQIPAEIYWMWIGSSSDLTMALPIWICGRWLMSWIEPPEFTLVKGSSVAAKFGTDGAYSLIWWYWCPTFFCFVTRVNLLVWGRFGINYSSSFGYRIFCRLS